MSFLDGVVPRIYECYWMDMDGIFGVLLLGFGWCFFFELPSDEQFFLVFFLEMYPS